VTPQNIAYRFAVRYILRVQTTETDEPTISTGEAARYLKVSRQAIVRSIERGTFQPLPRLFEGAHRRLPVSEVLEFMRRNNIAIPAALLNL